MMVKFGPKLQISECFCSRIHLRRQNLWMSAEVWYIAPHDWNKGKKIPPVGNLKCVTHFSNPQAFSGCYINFFVLFGSLDLVFLFWILKHVLFPCSSADFPLSWCPFSTLRVSSPPLPAYRGVCPTSLFFSATIFLSDSSRQLPFQMKQKTCCNWSILNQVSAAANLRLDFC